MSTLPPCPQCKSEYTYQDGTTLICPECAHEWIEGEISEEEQGLIAKDANGALLSDGDSVSVCKDLKIKGSSSVIKVGTKVKNIRLVEPDSNGDHNLDCKIEGIGALKITSRFVKKA